MPAVTPPSRPALRARYDGRRKELIDAAAKAFAEGGYKETSIADLSAATGLAAGGIYHYIGSKENLLIAICDDLLAPLLEEGGRSSPPTRHRSNSCATCCESGSPTSRPTAPTCSSSPKSAT